MIKATTLRMGAVLLLAGGLTAQAFRHPEHETLPNFDKRRPLTAATAETEAKKELGRALGRDVRGLKLNLHDSLGVPRWMGSTEDFLTGPQGVGKGVKASSAARFSANDPHRPVKAFVHEHAALFGHGAEALERARVEREWVTAHNGMRSVVWQQELDGISVHGAKFGGHITSAGELVSVMSEFVPDLDRAAGRVANRRGLVASPGLDARAALLAAGRNLGVVPTATTPALTARGVAEGAARRQKFSGGGLLGESDAQLTWFALDRETLRLAWKTVVTRPHGGEMYELVLDAQTGDVLMRRCLTEYLSDATYHVHTSDSPSPLSPGHATPLTNQPPFVPRTMVTTPAWNTNASPNGWINDGATETLGNNVDAHLDRNNDNQPDLPRPQGTAFRVFDYAVDFTQAPTTVTNQAYAVVQLFYLNNWIHDRLWELGFNEAAGNFQSNNFGRGGAGNDAVQADAQDGGGFNNANFATPPDGSAGRMQMYLFDGPNPDIDGDLDAEIVIHEYGHGLSNRKVGTGLGLSALQSRGMGEGWSDWYALTMLAEPGDAPDGNFAAGGYATFQLGGLNQNYYYGIRRYPYSTNLTKNPLTFKDIDPTQADPHAGIPRSPIIGNSATSVHNQGEVWCVTLWEMRRNLVAKHGFTNGNELALRLVTDGMTLAPNNPSFLEARDGIIMADLVLNGGANKDEIWTGFAKRGMGFSATSPASSTSTGVVEAFDLPDDLRITPTTGGAFSGPAGGPFLPASRIYTLTNIGLSNLTWVAVANSNWLSLSTNGGTLTVGGPTATLVVSINSNANTLPRGNYTGIVAITNLTSGRVQTRTFQLVVDPADRFTEFFETLDNDLDFTQFEFIPDGSSSFYSLCRRNAASFPTSTAGATVVVLGDDAFIQVTLGSGATVPFYGTNRNTFFIGSNGYITFGSGDTEYVESFASHFDLVRISALFLDLFPPDGGTISWQQFGDRVVVTWENIREFGTTLQNSMQVEMFFDGRIRTTYLNVSSLHGLAGFSTGGGVPVPFIESDLSVTPICLPPLLVAAPAVVSESAGVLTNGGQVYFAGTPFTNDVTITLGSANTNELAVPPSVVILAGQTNAVFSLTIFNDALVDGPKTVAISATSPGFPAGNASVIVTDDEPVAITLNLPTGAVENAGTLSNAGSVTLSAPPVNNVAVVLTSSNLAKLSLPASVTVLAGQTSAVFNVTIVNNGIIDGNFTVGALASVASWTNGFDTIIVFDDETSGNPVDHFQLSPVATNQAVGVPFELTISARDIDNNFVVSYLGAASLTGLKLGNPALPVNVLAFTGYASPAHFTNTRTAISNHFTNFVLTPTVSEDPAVLRAELAGKQVFLVPEQALAPGGSMATYAVLWGPVLREFAGAGGVVIVCTEGNALHLLSTTGLMDLSLVGTVINGFISEVAVHPLLVGFPGVSAVDSFAGYGSSNGQSLLIDQNAGDMMTAVRDFGLGHAILIGSSFNTTGSALDRVLANAVDWSRTSRYDPVVVTPTNTGTFSNGVWIGSVTAALPGQMLLFAADTNGNTGFGNWFTVTGNAIPTASNFAFSVLADTTTNLPLAGFDPEGTPLTFLISQPPTNGLLSALTLPTNIFGFTPVHAFVGLDTFFYRVSDGAATSAPALVNISIIAPADTDNDGIPDVWEDAHGLNSAVDDAAEDADNDGLTNYQEYLADSDPQNPSSGAPAPTVTALTNGHMLVAWPGVGGVRYRVQFSDGVSNAHYNGIFTDVPRAATLEISPASLGGSTNMSFLDDFTITGGVPSQSRRFYKLKVIR